MVKETPSLVKINIVILISKRLKKNKEAGNIAEIFKLMRSIKKKTLVVKYT